MVGEGFCATTRRDGQNASDVTQMGGNNKRNMMEEKAIINYQ
jgi:hypothetical protein